MAPASPQLLGALRFCLQGTRAPFCPVNGLSVRSPPAGGAGVSGTPRARSYSGKGLGPLGAQGRLCAMNAGAGAALGTGGDTKGRNGGTRPALGLCTAWSCVSSLVPSSLEMLLQIPRIPAGKGRHRELFARVTAGMCWPGGTQD